jgi:parallel beta-helix repeat protein
MLKNRLLVIAIALGFLISSNIAIVKSESNNGRGILVVDCTNASALYTNISEALMDANENDVIYVNSGVYYENLVINKSVSIISNNSGLAVIDSLGNIYTVLIKAPNVTLSGFTITNSTIGVYINGINNTVSNNIITNNSNGIFFENSSKENILLNNNIKDNSEAISLYNSSYNTILENIFFNNSYFGIKLWEISTNNIIKNNTFNGSSKAIILGRWSNFNNLHNNTLISEDFEDWGILIDHCYHNFVKNNIFLNCKYGLYLTSTNNNTIKNNTFEENYYGIYKKNSDEENLSEYNFFKGNNEDIKYEAKPPSIKLPSSEVTIVIVISIVLLFFFFVFPKKK